MKNNDFATLIDCIELLVDNDIEFDAKELRSTPDVRLPLAPEGYAVAAQKAVALCRAHGILA